MSTITTEQLAILTASFPKEDIEDRKGQGRTLLYVSFPRYIERLNLAFNGAWSFEVKDTVETATDIKVLGRLTAGGVVKEAWGAWKIGIFSQGNNQGEIMDAGGDRKKATTDAFKKCCGLFGMALELEEQLQGKSRPSVLPASAKQVETLKKLQAYLEPAQAEALGASLAEGMNTWKAAEYIRRISEVLAGQLDQQAAA